jgi:hypothetical protein
LVAHLVVDDVHNSVTFNTTSQIVHVNKWIFDTFWQRMYDQMRPIGVQD